MVLTFLEMGDHILRDYAIKNGGYMSLMQNKIVLKVENAIFFQFSPGFLKFWNFFDQNSSDLTLIPTRACN